MDSTGIHSSSLKQCHDVTCKLNDVFHINTHCCANTHSNAQWEANIMRNMHMCTCMDVLHIACLRERNFCGYKH